MMRNEFRERVEQLLQQKEINENSELSHLFRLAIQSIKRDMEERGRSLDSVINQYLGVVKPMYHQFIESTKRYADIVIPEGVSNTVAIDLLTTKIAKILEEARNSK